MVIRVREVLLGFPKPLCSRAWLGSWRVFDEWGFFGCPKPSLSAGRFDELCRFCASVCFAQIPFCARSQAVVPGDVGAATLAAELAAAAGGADFIHPHTRAAPLARRAGGIGGAERNRKNSLTAHSGYFSIFAVQQACPL